MAKHRPIGALAKDIQAIREDIIGDPRNIYTAANYVQAAAKLLAPANNGTLRQSISVTVDADPRHVYAHIGTNLAYASYVEFGTGPKGQRNHQGTSPEVPVAYQLDPWWIHETQVPTGDIEKYHWQYIDTDQGRFYKIYGQAAQPYLYPAVKNNEQIIGDLIAGSWEKAIRRKLK